MRILRIVLLSLLAIGVATAQAAPANPSHPQHPAGTIGIKTIFLNWDHVNHAWPQEMRAFIATGSESEHCLTSLEGASDPWLIRAVFCSHSVFNGSQGVLVTVLFDPPGVNSDILINLNIYQERAHHYSDPIPIFTN